MTPGDPRDATDPTVATLQGELDRLRAVMDALVVPNVVYRSIRDDAGRIVDFAYLDANAAACRFNGLALDDMRGQTLLGLFPEHGPMGLIDRFAAVVDTGEPMLISALPFRDPREPDRVGFFDTTVVRVADGLSQTWQDVTDRVVAERALVDSEARYRVLTESMRDVVWVLDTEDLRFRYVSPSVEALRGYTPDEIMAEPMDAALTPEGSAYVRSVMTTYAERSRRGELPADQFFVDEIEQPRKDGSSVWTEVITSYHYIPESDRVEVWGVTREITERRAVATALTESEERYRLLAENASDVVFRLSADGLIEWVSPSVEDLAGWSPDELVGRPATDLLHPQDVGGPAVLTDLVRRGRRTAGEVRVRLPSGEHRWLSVAVRPVTGADGLPVGLVGSGRDVTAEVEGRRALERSEQRLRLVMDSAPTGMALVDDRRRFTRVNPALCRMLGRDADWLLSHRVSDVVHPDDDAADVALHQRVMGGHDSHDRVTLRMQTGSGGEIVVEHSAGVLRDEDGGSVFQVSQFVDVTEAHRSRERLHFLASHDALTSLANRHELVMRMDEMLARPAPSGRSLGVLFVDLDHLKQVNDTYGHGAGDQLLVEVSRRIAAKVRHDDIVARIGGDEFVVVLGAVPDIAVAESVAGTLQEAVGHPVDLDGVVVTPSFSIGVAVAEPGESTEDVLARADAALYRAKREGRGRIRRYDPLLDPGVDRDA